MRQFQVPQFITIEDRIIGPLTLKQFFYLLGSAASIVTTWFVSIIAFILVGLPLAGGFAAMAFVKINDQPLPTVISNAVSYYTSPRLYVWRADATKPRSSDPKPLREKPAQPIQPLEESKLKELAWSLDITETMERKRL